MEEKTYAAYDVNVRRKIRVFYQRQTNNLSHEAFNLVFVRDRIVLTQNANGLGSIENHISQKTTDQGPFWTFETQLETWHANLTPCQVSCSLARPSSIQTARACHVNTNARALPFRLASHPLCSKCPLTNGRIKIQLRKKSFHPR